jgi:hypothetical protein
MHFTIYIVYANKIINLQLGNALGMWLPTALVPIDSDLEKVGAGLSNMFYISAIASSIIFALQLLCECGVAFLLISCTGSGRSATYSRLFRARIITDALFTLLHSFNSRTSNSNMMIIMELKGE